jgi:hypothetical protein
VGVYNSVKAGERSYEKAKICSFNVHMVGLVSNDRLFTRSYFEVHSAVLYHRLLRAAITCLVLG